MGGRLITGQQHDCLPYVIAIVSALSVGDPFIQDYHLDENQPGESGDEDDEDDDNLDRQELQNLRNQSTLDKQKRKLTRKKYYQSQIVKHKQKRKKKVIFLRWTDWFFLFAVAFRNMLALTPKATFWSSST